MKTAAAPFPFTSMFQNGPLPSRVCSTKSFSKPGKDFPPRAHTARPCRLRALLKTHLIEGKGGKCKAKTILRSWPAAASLRSESWRRNHC